MKNEKCKDVETMENYETGRVATFMWLMRNIIATKKVIDKTSIYGYDAANIILYRNLRKELENFLKEGVKEDGK